MKSICIFDLDGTLVDSMPRYTAGMYKVLDEEGIEYAPDLIKTLTPLGYTKSAEYYINELGVQGTVSSIVARMEENLVREYTENIKLKPGVEAYLKERKAQGASLYVLTASPHIATDPCLKNNGVFDLFDQVWSVEDFGLSKSGTALFYKVAETLGCKTSDIEFFDDNPTALENAKASGMITYGILDRQDPEDIKKVKDLSHYYVQGFDLPIRSNAELHSTICRFCGLSVEQGLTFCPKCGERIYTEAERQARREADDARRNAIKKRNRTIALSVIGGVLAVFVLFLVVGLINSMQFVGRGTWSEGKVFSMKDAGIQFTLPDGFQNITRYVSVEGDSPLSYDAIIASENGSRILFVARTTEKMTNFDGSPVTEKDVMKNFTGSGAGSIIEGAQVKLIGSADTEELAGRIYQRAYFDFSDAGVKGFIKILVRKEKESFVMIMAMFETKQTSDQQAVKILDNLTSIVVPYQDD